MTEIFGHRGARGLYPENTIQGFLYAAGLGINGIELDVVVSKDKRVVVSHEPWMNPKTCTKPPRPPAGGGKGRKVSFLRRKNLYKMNYEDIKRYDCGIRGHPDFPQQQKMPAYKPLLSEVIEQVESSLRLTTYDLPLYLIEIKGNWISDLELHPPPEEFVELVINELKPFNINNRIIIQSFDMRPLNILHQLNVLNSKSNIQNPTFKLGMLVRSPRFIRRRMKALTFVPDTCGIYYKFATEKWISRIKQMGMKAFVWTENEKEDMQRHISMGVDGIITDYPDVALNLRNSLTLNS